MQSEQGADEGDEELVVRVQPMAQRARLGLEQLDAPMPVALEDDLVRVRVRVRVMVRVRVRVMVRVMVAVRVRVM